MSPCFAYKATRFYVTFDWRLCFRPASWLFLLAATAFAQVEVPRTCSAEPAATTVSFGEIVDCQIDVVGDTDQFRFQGTVGETITLQVVNIGGPGEPLMQLYAPNGTLLVNYSSRFNHTLSASGQYTILVNENGINQTVSYRLALERISPPSPTAKTIAFGAHIDDSIHVVGDLDTFQFAGSAGETITLQVTNIGGLGDTLMQLYAPDGTLLVNYSNRFNHTLQSAGQYTILVNENGINQTVSYRLALERLSPASPSARGITFGSNVDDSINPVGDPDVFYFAGSANAVVSFQIVGIGGSGQPLMQLYAPNGTLLVNYTTSFNHTLQTTGQYTILVNENGINQTVDYRISAQCVTGNCGEVITLISPLNGATGIPSAATLAWQAANSASSYDVYLGTTSSPSLVASVAGTSYTPSALAAGTLYFWRVAITGNATSISPVWSFTTAAGVSCGFQLSQSAFSVQAAGGSGTVTVTNISGVNCPWTVTNPASWVVLTGGAGGGTGSGSVTFDILPNSSNSLRSTTLIIAGIAVTVTQSGVSLPPVMSGLRFVPMVPCRLVDTRPVYAGGRSGAFGPPRLDAGSTRTIPITSSATCAIPSTAKAYAFNVTLDTLYDQTNSNVDSVTIWPDGEPRPSFYTARTSTGGYIANAAIVKAGLSGAVNVHSSQHVNFILDIFGYFTDDLAGAGLLYYPIGPCRAVDTRGPIYSTLPPPYGNQRFQARENRTLFLPGSPACQIPPASAYSMQLTLAPGELTNGNPVAFITAYPTGLPQPVISNMNSIFGYAVANSAIVPARADGSIDVYAYDATNLIIDVNGYFAPDDGTGRGLSYFPVAQCRLMNTQDATYIWPFGGPQVTPIADRTLPISGSSQCPGLPSTAKAWALNASVEPNGVPMPFLSLWPDVAPWPGVSQLNAFQGQKVANSAIVPASSTGAIQVKVNGATHMTLEVAGYFGR